jgi:periplasmic protein TonB
MPTTSISPRSVGPETLGRPTLQSLALHGGVVVALLAWALISAHIHGNSWGNNSPNAGAIQATMVSSAPAIPLPRDEQKPTENVLATDTPSPAPAPPAPKATQAEDVNSIPIPVKQPEKTRLEPKKQVEQPKPVPQAQPQTQSANHVRLIKPNERAQYGQEAANVPRSVAQATPASQVNVQGGDFGARFPWYVDVIRRKTAQNWYKQEVEPSTPAGARVFLAFSVARDGSPGNVRVAQSSGSASLDSSCMRAVQRVDTYGSLPSGYNGSSLEVSYYCEQSGR